MSKIDKWPSLVRCVEVLKTRGQTGASAQELCGLLDRCPSRVTKAVSMGEQFGVIESWPEPMGRSTNRRRYYAAGMRPEKAPEPIKTIRKPTKGASDGAVKVLAYRWHTELPTGYISALNPQECRPWAQAATA